MKTIRLLRARHEVSSVREAGVLSCPRGIVVLSFAVVAFAVWQCLTTIPDDAWYMSSAAAGILLFYLIYRRIERDTAHARGRYPHLFAGRPRLVLFRSRWRVTLAVVGSCALAYLLQLHPSGSFLPLILCSVFCMYGLVALGKHVDGKWPQERLRMRMSMLMSTVVAFLWGLGTGLAVHFLDGWPIIMLLSVVGAEAMAIAASAVAKRRLYARIGFGMLLFGIEGGFTALMAARIAAGAEVPLQWRWIFFVLLLLQLGALSADYVIMTDNNEHLIKEIKIIIKT
jgi:hypothetical protein